MTRLMTSLAMAAVLATGATVASAPAHAQAGNRTLTIFGNDPCPKDAICVRAPESHLYRLPQSLNPHGTRQQRESWSNKAQALSNVGATGTGSCSAVGPGGFTGCLTQQINQARKESQEQADQDRAPE